MNQLSIQSAGWYGVLFGDAKAEEAFAFIKSCGFDAVDHNLDSALTQNQIKNRERSPFFAQPREKILEYYRPIKKAAEKAGVAFGQAHAPFPLYVEGDPDYNEYLIHVVEELLYVCADIGCPALVVHPIKTPDNQRQWELNIAMYRKLIPTALETGVKICLENLNDRQGDHPIGGVCATGEEAARYIDTLNEMAGADCFGFCLDVGHANMAAQNLRQMINTLGHRLTILHIHDNDGVYDRHMAPYTCKSADRTQTALDWEGLFAGLRDIGYAGTLNFETFGALLVLPKELIEPTLHYIHAIGQYFQSRLN